MAITRSRNFDSSQKIIKKYKKQSTSIIKPKVYIKSKKLIKDDRLKVNRRLNKSKKQNKNIEGRHSAESLVQALNAVGNGFNIPKSTLHSKVKNLTSVDAKNGPPTILSKAEEDDIDKWVIYCTEQGFPVTKRALLDQVQRFITSEKRKTPFKNNYQVIDGSMGL